jgi:hypothetical protein
MLDPFYKETQDDSNSEVEVTFGFTNHIVDSLTQAQLDTIVSYRLVLIKYNHIQKITFPMYLLKMTKSEIQEVSNYDFPSFANYEYVINYLEYFDMDNGNSTSSVIMGFIVDGNCCYVLASVSGVETEVLTSVDRVWSTVGEINAGKVLTSLVGPTVERLVSLEPGLFRLYRDDVLQLGVSVVYLSERRMASHKPQDIILTTSDLSYAICDSLLELPWQQEIKSFYTCSCINPKGKIIRYAVVYDDSVMKTDLIEFSVEHGISKGDYTFVLHGVESYSKLHHLSKHEVNCLDNSMNLDTLVSGIVTNNAHREVFFFS